MMELNGFQRSIELGNMKVIKLQGLTKEQQSELLGRNPQPPLYYKFGDYDYNTNSKERVLSGINRLDELTKGFEMGCITIWTGLTNAGKTTVMTMITKQTINQGEKVFYFNGEQTKDDFKNNLYKQSTTKDNIKGKRYKNTAIVDYFVGVDETKRLNELYGNSLFVYNNEAKRTIDFILKAMEEVRAKYGVRVFMLDNFMQIDTSSSDEYREQKEIMEKLRTFAVNKNVHIHLVAHPRKTDKFQTRITIYDVLGSSNLVNKAYNVISIIRTDNLNEDDNEYKRLEKLMLREGYDITVSNSILEILKTKGERCGVVGLIYDPVTKTYIEQPKTKTAEDYKKEQIEERSGAECPFPF